MHAAGSIRDEVGSGGRQSRQRRGRTLCSRRRAKQPTTFQAFSKFDFVPGEKIVAFEDFSQDAIGDFPAKWNTDAAGEIVTIAGQTGRWLKLSRGGFFTPELVTELPENVTVEFDLLVRPAITAGFRLEIGAGTTRQPQERGRLGRRPKHVRQQYVI